MSKEVTSVPAEVVDSRTTNSRGSVVAPGKVTRTSKLPGGQGRAI